MEIHFKEVSKWYGTFPALRDIDFSLSGNGIYGLLGPNGAGKSTLMQLLTGCLKPTRGKVSVQYNSGQTSLTGYLPEDNPLEGDVLVWDYLRYMARLSGLRSRYRNQAVKDAVHQTQIQDKLAQPVRTLSLGYRQRVGLAQALLGNPGLLVLDEPSSGLDPNQQHELHELLRSLSRERLILLSSHRLEEVKALCGRVLLLHEGQLKLDHMLEGLQSQPQATKRIELKATAARIQEALPAEWDVNVGLLDGASPGCQCEVPAHHLEAFLSLAVEHHWPIQAIEEAQTGEDLETMFARITQN